MTDDFLVRCDNCKSKICYYKLPECEEEVIGNEARTICLRCNNDVHIENEVACNVEESYIMKKKFENTFRRLDEISSDTVKMINTFVFNLESMKRLVKHQRGHFDRIFKEKMK